MLFFFDIDHDKVIEAEERIRNYAEGMDKALFTSFDDSTAITAARTQREIKTLMAVEFAENPFVEALVEKREEVLGRKANLKILDRSIPLRAFKARQTPEGVVVDTVRGGHEQLFYPSAFGPKIAKLGGNIFVRAGKRRFPLIKKADLKVSQIEGVPARFNEQVQKYKEVMLKRLEREKARVNKQYGKRIYDAAT